MNGKIVIRSCSCNNKFQDKEHGKNRRVHNVGGKNTITYKCTSCGTKKQ